MQPTAAALPQQLSALALTKCSLPAPEHAERAELGVPRLRLFPSLVLPELRAMFHPVSKCASSTLTDFFAKGPKPLFRTADARDGVGSLAGHFVQDLGQTAESRRMKRDFMSFTFVCHPLKRLVSAYGTINKRTDGGYVVLSRQSPAYFWPSFTKLPRFAEPKRFEQFVKDLDSLKLSTLEILPYADAQWNGSLPMWLNDTLALHPPSRLVPIDMRELSRTNTAYSRRLHSVLSSSSRLAERYRRGDTSAVYEVENSACTNWAHVTSQRALLGMVDSDGAPRRLDFIGRAEALVPDLRVLLRLLNVSESDLGQEQRAFLNGSVRALWTNAREGFKGQPSTRYRIAELLTNHSQGGAATLRRILKHYRADFGCLNYSLSSQEGNGMASLFQYGHR